MTIYRLPMAQNFPWFDFNTQLGGVTYAFEMRYNVRNNRWFMAIKNTLGVPVLAGIPLLIERSLIGQFPTLPLPNGNMFCLDLTGARKQPTLSSWLTTHALYYSDA